MAVGKLQGARPRPAGGPATDLHAGHTGQPACGPAWAGREAGHPPEPPGLVPGQGRPGGPATHQTRPAWSPA